MKARGLLSRGVHCTLYRGNVKGMVGDYVGLHMREVAQWHGDDEMRCNG